MVMVDEVFCGVMKITEDVTKMGSEEEFLMDLEQISEYIQCSVQSSRFRESLLAKHEQFLPLVTKTFSVERMPVAEDPMLMVKLRLIRAVVILLRNVLVISQPVVNDYCSFYKKILEAHEAVLGCLVYSTEQYGNVVEEDFLLGNWTVCFLQCLSNLSGNFRNAVVGDVQQAAGLLHKSGLVCIISRLNDLVQLGIFSNASNYHLFLVYLNQFIVNNHQIVNQIPTETSSDEVTNWFVYHLLSQASGNSTLVDFLATRFVEHHNAIHFNRQGELRDSKIEEIDVNQSKELFLVFASIAKNIIIHESFGKFLLALYEQNNKVGLAQHLLQTAQILLTNLQSLTNLQLAVVLSWVMEVYQMLKSQVELYFVDSSKTDAKPLYENLFMVLDIVSHLLAFEYSVKYLNNYNFLGQLTQLLKTLHENIKPITRLAEKDRATRTKDARNFPSLKKLLIEAITHLVAENHNNQEFVRNTHALEVILSMCVIDELNPFIKETAIICIKFLLKDNSGNQDFVRKLEAKKIVNEDELKKNGVELEMKDGKVGLKRGK